MIDHPAPAICMISDLNDPGAKGFAVMHRGQLIEGIVVHWQGHWYGYRNVCPHTGVNLDWLPDQFFDLQQRYLHCSLHGALFKPDNGYCVHGPCASESLAALPLRIAAQRVYLDVARLSRE
jgi:nitrite reductase/ring-hydroxylating ferredoxin subunit